MRSVERVEDKNDSQNKNVTFFLKNEKINSKKTGDPAGFRF